ncbi:MAG: hypothetical protein VCB25_11205 [Myxococcota bacterium]
METSIVGIPDRGIIDDAGYVVAAEVLVEVSRRRQGIMDALDAEVKAAYAEHKRLVAARRAATEEMDAIILNAKLAMVSHFDALGGNTEMPDEVVSLVTGIGWKSNWTARCTDMKAFAAEVAAGNVPIEALEINKKWLSSLAKEHRDMFSVPGCTARQTTVLAVFTKEEK